MVIERLPLVASKVFEQCTTEVSMLLIDDEDDEGDDYDVKRKHIHLKHADELTATRNSSTGITAPKQMAR